jgi:hypothetical protein
MNGAPGVVARLADRVLGHARLAAVGGFAEEDAGGAVLGVALELVGDVGRRCAFDVMAVDLDGASAVGAAELGVGVDEGFGDGLELPEGFIATAYFEAAAFYLALVDFFGFGGHGVLLGDAVAVGLTVSVLGEKARG